MAGRGRAPKPTAQRRNKADVPQRGEWQDTPKVGWPGEIPRPPTGLLKASRETWATWFGAWYAAHWSPNDLPSIRQMIKLYDQVERGEYQRATELRLQQDTWGITPKGQQDRRWAPPKVEPAKPAGPTPAGPYGNLTVVKSA